MRGSTWPTNHWQCLGFGPLARLPASHRLFWRQTAAPSNRSSPECKLWQIIGRGTQRAWLGSPALSLFDSLCAPYSVSPQARRSDGAAPPRCDGGERACLWTRQNRHAPQPVPHRRPKQPLPRLRRANPLPPRQSHCRRPGQPLRRASSRSPRRLRILNHSPPRLRLPNRRCRRPRLHSRPSHPARPLQPEAELIPGAGFRLAAPGPRAAGAATGPIAVATAVRSTVALQAAAVPPSSAMPSHHRPHRRHRQPRLPPRPRQEQRHLHRPRPPRPRRSPPIPSASLCLTW